MASVTLKGNPFNTVGNLPAVGTAAPNFTLVKGDLSTVSLTDFLRKKVILNIFPSVDTGTCAQSVRNFNAKAASLENTEILCISKDLPFAQNRFCGAEGIDKVHTLSDFRSQFGNDYGVSFSNGPLEGLLSRAIVVIDEMGIVVYTEQVSETVDEPNYDLALEKI